MTPLFGEGEDKEVHINDLRRTLASYLSDFGFKSYAGQILGHVTKGVTEVYTRTAAGPLQGMVEQAGNHIMEKLGFIAPSPSPSKESLQIPCPTLVTQSNSYLWTFAPMTFVSSFETKQIPITIDE